MEFFFCKKIKNLQAPTHTLQKCKKLSCLFLFNKNLKTARNSPTPLYTDNISKIIFF